MSKFSSAEEILINVWETHTAAEFDQKVADAATAIMTDDPTLVHVPEGTGASGRRRPPCQECPNNLDARDPNLYNTQL